RRLQTYFEEAEQQERSSRPTVVIGTPGLNRHSIEVFACATSLRRNGCQVTYLGAEVPLKSWLSAVDSNSADAVCIQVPTPEDASTAAKVIAKLSASRPRLRIYVTGEGAADLSSDDIVRVDDTSIATCVARILADHAEVSEQAETQQVQPQQA